MKLRAIPIDFIRNEAGVVFPKDQKLHALAVDYAENHLAAPTNFSEYAKVWAICEVDGEKILSVQGLLGYSMRPDFTLNRFHSPEAIEVGYQRADEFLADNGARGMEVTILMNEDEAPEQKCPQGLRTLLGLGARPSKRFSIKVR